MKKITAENFITDNKTNKVFLSSLIDKTSGALDVDTRSKLKSKIKDFCPDCELLYNTMDVTIWSHIPIVLQTGNCMGYMQKRTFVSTLFRCPLFLMAAMLLRLLSTGIHALSCVRRY